METQTMFIVMGVSASGKSTLGKALAEQIGCPFIEGDDYHSAENIKKMMQGVPLNDADRAPWLQALNSRLKEEKEGAVVACSALKHSYREILTKGVTPFPKFIYLDCAVKLLEKRMQERNHFMPIGLLQSQLDTLEIPTSALKVAGDQAVTAQLNQILKSIR